MDRVDRAPSLFWIAATLCVISLAVLLIAERKKSVGLRAMTKPIASASFVAAALSRGIPAETWASSMFVALVLSLVGDVLLIPKKKSTFAAGIGAFLLAHLAFAYAFFNIHVMPLYFVIGVVICNIAAIAVGRGRMDKIPAGLRGPVMAYAAAIIIMVASAFATSDVELATAAMVFFVSDIAVARERFLKSGFENKLVGLPLYYGAQLVFAFFIATR